MNRERAINIGIVALLAIIAVASPIWSQDSLPVVLLTNETVKKIPQLEFVDGGGAIHSIVLSGTAPGRVFNGNLSLVSEIQSGTGEFRIVPGTMVSLATGKSGTEITKGRYYMVPNRVNAVLIQNRIYDFVSGQLKKP